MHQRAFAVVTTEAQLLGAWTLLNSIYAYYGATTPVYLFLQGPIAESSAARLARHPLGDALVVELPAELGTEPAGIWEARQRLGKRLLGRTRVACLVEPDVLLLSALDEAFVDADEGRIVAASDGGERTFGEEYDVYGPQLVGLRQPRFGGGLVCLDLIRHWDVVVLWSAAARYAEYAANAGAPLRLPGCGDQPTLEAVVAMQGKSERLQLYPQAEWGRWALGRADEDPLRVVDRQGAQWIVRNEKTGRRQRVLQLAGPPWWSAAGRRRWETRRQLSECFTYFANTPEPWSNPVPN